MKTPDSTKKAESSAPNSAKFTGTDNARHLRAIFALLKRPRPREEIDSIAGCSNGPVRQFNRFTSTSPFRAKPVYQRSV